MACSSCSQHRQAVASAVKSGDVQRIAQTTSAAVQALGQNSAGYILKMLKTKNARKK